MSNIAGGKIEFNVKESEVINLAIIELGGPFNTPFAKHLQHYHFTDYDRIREELNKTNCVILNDVQLIIDILQLFLVEPLESDWGTTYDGVNKDDVQGILHNIQKLIIAK